MAFWSNIIYFSCLSHGTNCLLDQTKRANTGTRGAQERTDETKLPGQLYSLDEQCKHIYDDRSYFCKVGLYSVIDRLRHHIISKCLHFEPKWLRAK